VLVDPASTDFGAKATYKFSSATRRRVGARRSSRLLVARIYDDVEPPAVSDAAVG
jgi:hypothetical protein